MKSFYLRLHALTNGPTLLAGLCLLVLGSNSTAAQSGYNEIVGTIAPSSSAPAQGTAPVTKLALAPANPQAEKSTSSPAAVPPVNPAAAPKPTAEEEQKMVYSFRADNLDLKTALATFARANNLNIVPDQYVSGMVI